MEEQLISAVFKRKAIWDPTDKLRKNSKILNTLWAQVADELVVDVKVAKSKWKNLRAYFVTELRKVYKVPRSGSHGSEKLTSSWSYFNQLLFLRDTLGTYDEARDDSVSAQGIDYSEQIESETATENETVDDPQIPLAPTTDQPGIDFTVQPTTAPGAAQDDFPPTSSSDNVQVSRSNTNKRKLGKSGSEERCTAAKRTAQFLAVEKRKVELLEKEMNVDNNPDLQFFKSLIPYMADFSTIQKLRVRSKIQDIILNEHEKAAQTSTYSGTPSCTYTSPGNSVHSPNCGTQLTYTELTSSSHDEANVNWEMGPILSTE